MFDRVWAKCPKCGGDVEYQTKVGDCLLRGYTIDAVPLNIARSINEDVSPCDNCGETWKIVADDLPPPTVIKMRLE